MDVGVASFDLGPNFLNDHLPYLTVLAWFSKDKLARRFVDWKIIIDDDFLGRSHVVDSDHVDALVTYISRPEDPIKPLFLN